MHFSGLSLVHCRLLMHHRARQLLGDRPFLASYLLFWLFTDTVTTQIDDGARLAARRFCDAIVTPLARVRASELPPARTGPAGSVQTTSAQVPPPAHIAPARCVQLTSAPAPPPDRTVLGDGAPPRSKQKSASPLTAALITTLRLTETIGRGKISEMGLKLYGRIRLVFLPIPK